MRKARLVELVDTFLRGDDVSKAHAWAIEKCLEVLEEDSSIVEQTLSMLASYQPGGGQFLFDQAALERQLRLLRSYLVNASGADQQ